MSQEKFNVNSNLKTLHIRFLPDQEAETNISSREFIKKAEFVNVDSLTGGTASAESTGDSGNGSGSDTPTHSSTGGGLPDEGD